MTAQRETPQGAMMAGDRSDMLRGRRVVVKVGSSSLTDAAGRLDLGALATLTDVLVAHRACGHDIVLVSSGAIAAGYGPLGLAARPKDLATAQAAASVGQGLLVARYAEAFARNRVTVGQVLLTAEDLVRRGHYANAHRTLTRLISLGVVPIINENDTVATAEIRFGDNDRLAALVAHLVQADALVLLTDVDGLYDRPPTRPGAHRIDTVTDLHQLAAIEVSGSHSRVGTGGMQTKLDAVAIATAAGVPVLLAGAADAGAALAGESVGTYFGPVGPRRSNRLLWLAHAAAVRGQLVLDDGAVRAVTADHRSLLPAGVVGFDGEFSPGDPVDLVDTSGTVVARGLVTVDSVELPAMLGRTTQEIAARLGPEHARHLVHADDLVTMPATWINGNGGMNGRGAKGSARVD